MQVTSLVEISPTAFPSCLSSCRPSVFLSILPSLNGGDDGSGKGGGGGGGRGGGGGGGVCMKCRSRPLWKFLQLPFLLPSFRLPFHPSFLEWR
jgi:hypothetical protein